MKCLLGDKDVDRAGFGWFEIGAWLLGRLLFVMAVWLLGRFWSVLVSTRTVRSPVSPGRFAVLNGDLNGLERAETPSSRRLRLLG